MGNSSSSDETRQSWEEREALNNYLGRTSRSGANSSFYEDDDDHDNDRASMMMLLGNGDSPEDELESGLCARGSDQTNGSSKHRSTRSYSHSIADEQGDREPLRILSKESRTEMAPIAPVRSRSEFVNALLTMSQVSAEEEEERTWQALMARGLPRPEHPSGQHAASSSRKRTTSEWSDPGLSPSTSPVRSYSSMGVTR